MEFPVDLGRFRDWCVGLLAASEEELPLRTMRGESIAAAVDRAYEELDPESPGHEVLASRLYEYRSRHCLTFGNRGVDMPDVYIGKLNGRMTMSCVKSSRGRAIAKPTFEYVIEDLNPLAVALQLAS